MSGLSLSSPWRTAWLAVALLWPVALLNYLDRQMLASMKFSVMHDITDVGSEANWGLMLGQFKWVYAFLSPLGGLVADRFGRRRTIVASLMAWSAVTWLTGSATTYGELLWARTLMGFSEAFYIPAALALITDHHEGATRSRAVGVHQMAIVAGTMLGGFTGYVADAPDLGWRWAFHAAGLAGLAYALPLAWLLPAPPPRQRHDAPTPVLRSLATLLSTPSFLLLVACFTLPALPGWVVRDWMPAILKERFAIGQGQAGVSASVWWSLAAIAGVVLGGWMADAWQRRHARGRIFTGAIGITLLAPALFGVGNAASLTEAVAFLLLFGLGWGLFDCNNMPILCQIARPELRATGYGLMNLVSISCGGLADWGFGRLRDAQVPLNGIFAAFAAMALMSAVLMLCIRPRTGADG
jgi:MFS family permease